ncbi:hypothetical protein QU666_05985 [Leptotrichia sp. HMT-225]|uniref:hypothetical protein n=2 Tax=unclassified Leptotrichia TaxID=2633022 RepID=UPI00272BBD2D|nr:hypothetical protein [Leptotrichia sp. HMT-225]WLD75420.1 hypothetical protein QU666_05985 [Leptotrichia sp. HMT-225]
MKMDMSTVKTDMETGIKLYVNIQSDNDDQEKENIYLRQGFPYRGMLSCLFSFGQIFYFFINFLIKVNLVFDINNIN